MKAMSDDGEAMYTNLSMDAEEPEQKLEADADVLVRQLIRELTMLNRRRGSGLKVGNVTAQSEAFAARTRRTSQSDFRDSSLKARFEIDFFAIDLK
jgi:hypothetical protein